MVLFQTLNIPGFIVALESQLLQNRFMENLGKNHIFFPFLSSSSSKINLRKKMHQNKTCKLVIKWTGANLHLVL